MVNSPRGSAKASTACAGSAAPDLLVQLGQLAADHQLDIRQQIGDFTQRRGDTMRRFEDSRRHARGGDLQQRAAAFARAARQKPAQAQVGAADARGRPERQRRRRAGDRRHGQAGAHRRGDEFAARVGDARRARVADQRDVVAAFEARQQQRRGAGAVAIVVGRGRRRRSRSGAAASLRCGCSRRRSG